MRISAALVDDENYVNMAETRFVVEFTPRPIRFQLSLPSDSSWATVQSTLLQGCGLSPTASAVRVTYADDEDERVLLSSEPEMQEAIRIAEMKGNVLQVQITEEDVQSVSDATQPLSSPHNGSVSGEFVFVGGNNASDTQAEASVAPAIASSEASSALPRADAGDGGTSPPAWFVDFVRSFRNELKDEVTAEVFKRLDERKVDKWTAAATAAEAFPDAPTCGNCRCQVQGVRYRCWICPNYDLCEVCESLPSVHDSSHAMLKIRKPAGSQQQIPRRKRSNGCTFRPIRSPNRASAIREMKQEMKMQKLMKKLEKYNLRDSNIYRLPGASSSSENYLNPDAYDSEFVCDDTIPDWTHVQPGTRFTKRWKVRNSGNRAWDENILLKYCWGTLGLMPNDTDIEAPRLLPNEEGMLEVQFTAPHEPGHYQTHWRMFSPQGYFGHRLWCNVVVDPALTLEPKQKHMSSLKVVAGADDDFSHEPTLKPEDFATGLKANIVSHTATPFNTPAAVTPRKSPEPEEVEESNVAALGSNMSILDMPILQDTEESASVLSLSSVETEADFEVVPLPSCFNLNIPFNHPEPKPAEERSESALQSAATSCEVIAKTPRCNYCGAIEYIPSSAVAPPQGYSDNEGENAGTPILPLRFRDPLTESDASNSSTETTQTSTADIKTPSDHDEKQNEASSPGDNPDATTSATKPAFSTRKTYKVEAVGDALPEALVTGALNAAATVFNTAKTVFTGIQQEKQRMSSSQWIPPAHLAPENKLFEMGFRNRELNSVLLKKHSGDIQKVIEELINATVESWSTTTPMEGPPTARPFMCSFD
ncbi:next to BRCA1 gene 1 protein-like [Dermacentor albipictus]|uniref:next to BRCA1 gene 1 protein-like n=1 Tax=Dermacentor albipictus TaxID=60249 RepID=UPI0031FDBF56